MSQQIRLATPTSIRIDGTNGIVLGERSDATWDHLGELGR